jgi:hypothetical protein
MMTIGERWAVLLGAIALGMLVAWIWIRAVDGDSTSTGEYEISSAGERDPAVRAALEMAMETERRFRDGEKARERARAALRKMEARELREMNDGK